MKDQEYSASAFIGETTRGVRSPVFFDLHTPIYNNRPPGTLIVGSPGGGKSFCAMLLTVISAIVGKTTIVIDPKGDFLSLHNLKDEMGDIKFWNLGDTKGKKGVLDPFYMSREPKQVHDLVITTVEMLVGGIDTNELKELSPVVKDVINSPTPSLVSVTETLRMSSNEHARNLGVKLEIVKDLPFAELCFAPGNKRREPLKIESGTTIITMVGLDIAPTLPGEKMSNKKRLSSTIFYLVTDFIRRILHNTENTFPKTLVIDEAWVLSSTPAGASVIQEVSLLGRSKSVAMVLITQSEEHLGNMGIDNTISTKFAFRTNLDNATHIIKGMRLDEDEKFEEILPGLEKGECLMQDYRNRYATVQIKNIKPKWAKAFESNPLKKLQASKDSDLISSNKA